MSELWKRSVLPGPFTTPLLQAAESAFARGSFEVFIENVLRLWRGHKRGPKLLAYTLLPHLYQRFIGLANVDLAFELYALSLQPRHPQVLASVVSRMVFSEKRIRSSAGTTFQGPLLELGFPTPQRNATGFCLWTRQLSEVPQHWKTPPLVDGPYLDTSHGAARQVTAPSPETMERMATRSSARMSAKQMLVNAPQLGKATGGDKDEKHQRDGKDMPLMESQVHQATWTDLVSGTELRESGGRRHLSLIQCAFWLERLRPHLDAQAFLVRLKTMCELTPSQRALRPDLDNTAQMSDTLRLFMRTMRTFLINAMGDRTLSLFYMFVVHHIFQCVHTQPTCHDPTISEQLFGIDKHMPAVLQLQKVIHGKLLAPPGDTVAVTAGRSETMDGGGDPTQYQRIRLGLPAIGASIQGPVDWNHPVAKAWIATIGRPKRAAALSTDEKAKRDGTRDRQNAALEAHLAFVEKAGLAEFKAISENATLKGVDSDILKPLPLLKWGENWRGRVDPNGHIWVGPFPQTPFHNTIVGRALLVNRKLREWTILEETVTATLYKDSRAAKPTYWLAYSGIDVASGEWLRTVQNATTPHMLTENIAELRIESMRRAEQHGYSRNPMWHNWMGLLGARALLGVGETKTTTDTVRTRDTAKVYPTATFVGRSAKSYKATVSQILLARKYRVGNRIYREESRLKLLPQKLSDLDEIDVRRADTLAVLFGAGIRQQFATATTVENIDRMHDLRNHLRRFYDALKRDVEFPQMGAAVEAIHRAMPRYFSPDVLLRFHISLKNG
jgi:hypothetical protein